MNPARAPAGFALAFALASIPACFSLIPTQAMSGRETTLDLAADYGVGWFFLFAIGSFVWLRNAGVKGKKLGICTLGFAGGGAMAGLLIVLLLRIHVLGSPLTALLFLGIPLLLPWMIGWVVLKWAL